MDLDIPLRSLALVPMRASCALTLWLVFGGHCNASHLANFAHFLVERSGWNVLVLIDGSGINMMRKNISVLNKTREKPPGSNAWFQIFSEVWTHFLLQFLNHQKSHQSIYSHSYFIGNYLSTVYNCNPSLMGLIRCMPHSPFFYD